MSKQEKTALITSAAHVFITAVKFVLASITGSAALLAEAYHSFADILTSLSVFTALRRDRKNINGEEPPFPEEKKRKRLRVFRDLGWDAKAASAIGVLLILAALGILLKVFRAEPSPLKSPMTAAALLAVPALCSYLLYRFETAVGEACGSQALVADGRHAKSDMLVTVMVMATLLGDRMGLRIDRAVAVLIGFLILSNGIATLKKGLSAYRDARRGKTPDGEIVLEDSLVNLTEKVVPAAASFYRKSITSVPGLGEDPSEARDRLAAAVVVLGLISYFLSGFYTLSPSEEAVVERFGRPTDREHTVKPGLHYRFPRPIDRVRRADTRTIRRMAAGYVGMREDEDLILWTNVHYLEEHPFLTGENSFLDSATNIHYRIKNLHNYLYTASDPYAVLEQLAYRSMLEIFGRREFFHIVTSERDRLEDVLRDKLQKTADDHELGIEIISICFRDLHPPTSIAPVFEDVVSAQEDYETSIEEARGYTADLLPRSRAEAHETLLKGRAYKKEIVLRSNGEAQSFLEQCRVYESYPEVTKTRMVLRAMEENLPPVRKYIVRDYGKEGKPMMWFSLMPDGVDSEDWSFTTE